MSFECVSKNFFQRLVDALFPRSFKAPVGQLLHCFFDPFHVCFQFLNPFFVCSHGSDSGLVDSVEVEVWDFCMWNGLLVFGVFSSLSGIGLK